MRSWKELLIAPKWRTLLTAYLNENFDNIIRLIKKISRNNITPERKNIFRAFNTCDFNDTFVLLVGGDPWSGVEEDCYEADGLAFSFQRKEGDSFYPPTLKRIFQEIKDTVYEDKELPDDFYNPDLTRWANQGVLLLNTSLTTEWYLNDVHGLIWGDFIQLVMRKLNEGNPLCVILLGNEAKDFAIYFDESKHLVLRAGHPNPLNTKIPFFGTEVFKKCNEWLFKMYKKKIVW